MEGPQTSWRRQRGDPRDLHRDALRLPRLRDERDRRPRAARRPRRAQARPSPRPLRDARPRPAAEPAVPQVGHDRRRGDGQVPPARRPVDLRHARPDGAGVLPALPARRRPGQLRLDRRRPTGGDAVLRPGDTRVAHAERLGADRGRSSPALAPESDSEIDLKVLDRLGRPVHASKLFHSGEHPTLRLRTARGLRAHRHCTTTRCSAWSMSPGYRCCSGSRSRDRARRPSHGLPDAARSDAEPLDDERRAARAARSGLRLRGLGGRCPSRLQQRRRGVLR